MAERPPVKIPLNTKEQRLFDYISNEDNSRNVGDICRALHTTPYTLLSKTLPGMKAKIAEWQQQYDVWAKDLGLTDL
jgi:hypothetical protein